MGLVLPQSSTEWPSCCGRLSLPGNVSLLSARRGSVMTPLLQPAAPTSRLQHRPHFAGFFHSDSQLPCSSGLVGCAPLAYCLQFAGLHTSRTSLCLICRPASECYPACSAGSLFGVARFLQGCTASGVPTQQLVSYASSPYSAPGILGSGPGHPRLQLGILGEHARGLVLANRLCFLVCEPRAVRLHACQISLCLILQPVSKSSPAYNAGSLSGALPVCHRLTRPTQAHSVSWDL